MKEPKVYSIPDDARFVPCRNGRCGQQITFVITEAGKKMPVNPDGTPHWANCPGVKQFKRRTR
jgi:hypothetical protein